MLRIRSLAGVAVTLVLVSCSIKGELVRPPVEIEYLVPEVSLPALNDLPAQSLGRKRISASSFELLANPPVSDSTDAGWEAGNLSLNGQLALRGLSYAIFELPGFPSDASILPTRIDLAADNQGWLALANYKLGRWEFFSMEGSGHALLVAGTDYISPKGGLYAAVVAYGSAENLAGMLNATSLLVQVSGNLPAGPIPRLQVLTPSPAANIPVQFSHEASMSGDGVFTGFTYDFGDGTDAYSTVELEEQVQHTYSANGVYTVTLEVVADIGGALRTSSAKAEVKVGVAGDPTARLNIVGERHAVKYAVRMDAALSDAGGGEWVSIHYDFGDSASETQADPAAHVDHTYEQPGSYTVTLTVEAVDEGVSKQSVDEVMVTVEDTFKELLVVFNSDLPESADLATYYCTPETGRAIDPAYKLGLSLGSTDTPAIDRITYNSLIRDVIKSYIDGQGIKDSLKYILLCKGVPHKISGSDEFSLYSSTCSSVDSELCLLYSDGSYPIEGHMWNEVGYRDLSGSNQSYYMGVNELPLSRDYSFEHGQYLVSDIDGNQFGLDYLVGRLSAYSYTTAKAMVDRALDAASTSASSGWVLMDTSEGDWRYDTMADPVWPKTDSSYECGAEVLTSAGQHNIIDLTYGLITGKSEDGFPPGAASNVIAVATWGLNHSGTSYPSGGRYILKDLQYTYIPGAAFMSYESFNGMTFTCSNPSDPSINHPGQGQICDFMHMGGTVGIGNVYEPWTSAMGDERVMYYRYVVERDRWIEAAYKGLRMLSWQEVVVGDPLCQLAP